MSRIVRLKDDMGSRTYESPDDPKITENLRLHVTKGEIIAYVHGYPAREIPLSDLADAIIIEKGRDVFAEYQRRGEEYGKEEFNELKQRLEREYHFCPFCDFPGEARDANWMILSSLEDLRSHIVHRHFRVFADLKIVASKPGQGRGSEGDTVENARMEVKL